MVKSFQIVSICKQQNKCEKKFKICFWKGINIACQGEDTGGQYFPLLPHCFPKFSFSGLSKLVIVWVEG